LGGLELQVRWLGGAPLGTDRTTIYMFQNLKDLYGRKIGARDGDIGRVKDFYFHSHPWSIRYIVADTESWLPGRLVLFAPPAFTSPVFGHGEADTGTLRLSLTRKQIEDGPSIGSHQALSRQFEESYYRHNGWPAYWETANLLPANPEHVAPQGPSQLDEIQLRSTKALTGYHLQTTEGPIGTIVDFMVHNRTWAIRELVVETGHWYSGKEVFLLPENISRISESAVLVNLSKEDIHLTGRNDVAQAGAGHL
jgi:hypothetical protein